MLKNILNDIQKDSSFETEININNHTLYLRGRYLSPSEVETASLSSSLILQSMKNESVKEIQELSKKLNSDSQDDIDDQILNRAYNILQSVRPEQLSKINTDQDLILSRCITQASSDGKSWERIHLVMNHDQMNGEQNRLWVGMIPKEERIKLINLVMKGHREAVERQSTFR